MKSSELERKIVYTLSDRKDTLYVNVIPKFSCVNSCRFCGRKDALQNLPNIYEDKAETSLYLRKAPSLEEVIKKIEKNLTYKINEIAFVGLGEPLLQFELIRDSISKIKNKHPSKNIRINTNGLVKNWIKNNPARELKQTGLNEIKISINAISEEEYRKLCRPIYKNAFEKLCEFTRNCIQDNIETKASFVVGFKDEEIKTRDKKDYSKFASSLGIKQKDIIFRKFNRI